MVPAILVALSAAVCANCSTRLGGPYCHLCGQHQTESHPATLGHLFHELTDELLHVDGKIWRTTLALLTRPGHLTREYWDGRRARWIGPFRIFLIAAALHLVLVPGIGPMNLPILLQRDAAGELIVAIGADAVNRATRAGRTELADAERDLLLSQLRGAYAALRYLAVPGFALLTLAVYWRRQDTYAAHLVLAVHYSAFRYLVSLGTSQLPYFAGVGLAMSASAIYLFVALRRVFGDSASVTALKTLGLYAGMILIEFGLTIGAALVMERGRG